MSGSDSVTSITIGYILSNSWSIPVGSTYWGMGCHHMIIVSKQG